MLSIINVIDIFLGFLETMMAIYGLFSLLLFFGVLSPYGRIAGAIWQNMNGLFEPMLEPIRKVIPAYRGFDWSFMILYLLVVLIRSLLREYGPLAAHAINSGAVQ